MDQKLNHTLSLNSQSDVKSLCSTQNYGVDSVDTVDYKQLCGSLCSQGPCTVNSKRCEESMLHPKLLWILWIINNSVDPVD